MKHLAKTIALLALLPLLCGCGATRIVAGQDTRRDSVRVEYREKTVYVPDTVFIEIPAQTAERTTPDSLSHLENDFSESNARINKDGSLFHDLKTKPQAKPVPTQKKIQNRDSIMYRDRKVYIEKPVVVVKPMSSFVKTQIWGFWIMLISAALYIFIKIKF